MKSKNSVRVTIYNIIKVVRAMSGKNQFLLAFVLVTLVLAVVRLVCPEVAQPRLAQAKAPVVNAVEDSLEKQTSQSAAVQEANHDNMCLLTPDTAEAGCGSIFFGKDGKEVRHRIFSVPHFGNTFPDQQDVQILAANQHGVSPVQNRDEAEHSKGRLVYVGSNPFFYVDKLNNSIPYLVPRASVLLQDIGRAYYDSLQIKGIPLHKIIVTSILRTKDDVAKLRTRNGNATENSCHLYGTTFDVCYNRYKTVQIAKEPRRQVRNDSLKWVLSEVLRDFRDQGRCYIKYEVKQGCFHITVR